MNINSLRLIHYRNYENFSFNFQPDYIYYIYGKNAQGKTNLIESIYYLSHLHSFRTNLLSSMIEDGQENMMIESKLSSHGQKEDLKIIVSNHKKHLFRYQNLIKKYSEFIGIANAILFCPDDMTLFNSSPKIRRNFIDIEIMKLSKRYTSTLSHYQYLLKNRNVLLKNEKIDETLLNIYTEQMIDDEKIIVMQRKKFINELMKYAKELYPFFSKDKEQIDARYITFIKDFENIEEDMKKSYENTISKDKMYCQTNIGIHRDDIQFLLNDRPVNEVASQGQKRSFLLALKLGLAQMIYVKTNEYPILLLDDVFSELDDFRKKELINKLPKNMQIFITTTERSNEKWFENRKVCFLEVENGVLKEVLR